VLEDIPEAPGTGAEALGAQDVPAATGSDNDAASGAGIEGAGEIFNESAPPDNPGLETSPAAEASPGAPSPQDDGPTVLTPQ
jgi:hypothetical protein